MTSKLLIGISIVLFYSCNCLAQCYSSNGLNSYGQLYYSSGSKSIDSIINSEKIFLEALFTLKIDHYYTVMNNAYYTNSTYGKSNNGSICLGTILIANEYEKDNGIESMKAILAHEWAHAYQNYWGWEGKGFQKELHADFIAGWYIGVKNIIYQQDITLFTNTFYELGDNDFLSPEHHGTPTERGCAFLEGFRCATVWQYNVLQAYYAGIDYVERNSPCVSFVPGGTYLSVPIATPVNGKMGDVKVSFKKWVMLFDIQGRYLGIFGPGKPFRSMLPYGDYRLTVYRCTKHGKRIRKPDWNTITINSNANSYKWEQCYKITRRSYSIKSFGRLK